MTKETIITDAITYIRELQTNVDYLSEQLLEMEATHAEQLETKNEVIIDTAEDMGKWGIEVGNFMHKPKVTIFDILELKGSSPNQLLLDSKATFIFLSF